jgi:hypothetical protein
VRRQVVHDPPGDALLAQGVTGRVFFLPTTGGRRDLLIFIA